jgi:glycosyltransferase involved in cell wall biosynthesis
MKVLFTTPLIAVPSRGGPELRVANSIRALARIVDLHVFPRRPVSVSTMEFLRATCENVIEAPAPTPTRLIVHRAARKVENTFLPSASALRRTNAVLTHETSTIVSYARAHAIDAVWFSYGCISYALMDRVNHAAADLRLICDTDSVWSQFISRELPYESSAARRAQIIRDTREKVAEEEQWVKFCDVTTAACDADAKYYQQLAKDPDSIKIFRNAIDAHSYEDDVLPPDNHRQPNLVMMGSYYSAESPMVKSARWMVAEVLPRVRAVVPQIHVYIVGKGSDRYLRDLESNAITVTGSVESTLPYLKHATVALAPLLFEAAATKYKVLEAAVCEVPVVATPVGAEGLPAEYHKYLRVCTSGEDFASAILDMLEKRDSMAEPLGEFRMHIIRDFGLEQLSREGAAILDYIQAR